MTLFPSSTARTPKIADPDVDIQAPFSRSRKNISSMRFLIPRRRNHKKRGAILILASLFMVSMLAVLAFAVDIGYICSMQTQLARSVDAAALAGAGSLTDGTEAANATALEYLVRNPVGNDNILTDDEQLAQLKAQFLEEHGDELEVSYGHWNEETGTLETDAELPSAMSVSMSYNNVPLFFAPVLGLSSFSIQAEAVAMYQPRDIMLVLDFSASMNDDSELKSIDALGQTAIEANILQIWQDLGSPIYGNMGFQPDWVTIPGTSVPAAVTWRTGEVDVAATTNMQKVKLYFSNGNNQTFTTSSQAGTWSGTGSNNGVRITKCKVKIQGVWETFDFYNNSHIRRGLGLNGVPYPSEGSWNDYIEYARSHSSSMPWYDGDVYSAGYRRKFGALTLINFWNKNKPASDETPQLWQASAQPVTAVKNAVDVFMDYVRAVDVDDRVGLSVYNSSSGNGTLESTMTTDLDHVADLAWHRQAGHYHAYTNIGAGLQVARAELQQHARDGAYKMIVLMTDGKANWTSGGYNEAAARQFVINEAIACESLKIPIVTISLGAGADVQLMNETAEISDGAHFNVPGGSTVAQYSQQLRDVFEEIASARPLKLVQ